MQSEEMKKLNLKKFGKHLKELREKKGLSINMFAYENDFSKSLISRIERGNSDIRLSTLLKLAEALEVAPTELLNFQDKLL